MARILPFPRSATRRNQCAGCGYHLNNQIAELCQQCKGWHQFLTALAAFRREVRL